MRLDRTLHAGTQACARLLLGVLGCCSSTRSLHVRTPAVSFLQQQHRSNGRTGGCQLPGPVANTPPPAVLRCDALRPA